MKLRLFVALSLCLFSCQEQTPDPIVLGQTHAGGLVYYVDAAGEHGWVCAELDQSGGLGWSNGSNMLTNSTNTAIGQAQNNTSIIVTVQGNGSYAAKICDDLVLNGYDDWYLPTFLDLNQMYINLKQNGLGNFANSVYWSSSEIDLNNALTKNLGDGADASKPKSDSWHVRAVRSF